MDWTGIMGAGVRLWHQLPGKAGKGGDWCRIVPKKGKPKIWA